MTFQFQTPVFLVGEGELPHEQFQKLYSDRYPLIAADGGANTLRAFGVTPKAVIGDMDSLKDRAFFEEHSIVLHLEDQNTTDLEKCLNEVNAPLYLALGFTGKRFDHTLEILHVLEKYVDKRIAFFSNQDVIVRLPRHFEIELPKHTRISLYPLKRTTGLGSSGLKYPLHGLSMEQGQMIGTSNENIDEVVCIQQSDEGLLGIFPLEFSTQVLSSSFNLSVHGSLDA